MNLSNANIAAVVEDVQKFFKTAGTDHNDILKICLVVEEALLRYQEHFGEDHTFELFKREWFHASRIVLRTGGEPFNPLQTAQDSDALFNSEIMQNLLHYDDSKTVYRYENGFNEIVAISPLRRKPWKIPGGAITVAVVAAIICSIAIGHLPQEMQTLLLDDIVAPVLSTLMKLIVTVTVFMMFFSIVSSICAIENTTMLSNIGVPVIRRFVLLDLCIIVLAVLISLIFFPVLSIDGGRAIHFDEFMKLLLSIIPTNFIEPFVKSNVLQVAVMAFFGGICIITIGSRLPNVKAFAAEINLLMFKVMDAVFTIMPAIIFLCIVKSLSRSTLSEAMTVWKIVAANCLTYAAFMLIMLAMLRLKTSADIPAFFRKIFPAFIVSLTTGSSSASLPQSLDVSKNNLHIDEKFCNFWIPLSLVLFSPSKLVQLTVSAFFASAAANEPISVAELFVVAFLAMQMSISTPNAGGGIAASFSILLAQLDLPLELIGSLMIADVITGNVFTGLNVVLRESELLTLATKMNFVKRN
ncbi:MAG: cation:dicarboxylase symporter family transporter [Quinella sp. 2Q5]|nr:cation:dicarboxylase symporter family transporter [Quinella sp. 2Q5]